MKYKIVNESIVFNDHYKILKAKVTYDAFEGSAITIDRLAFHRGDSVAILIYEEDTQSVLLTKQFRYPTTQHNLGWMLEIPAGSIEKKEEPESCVIRETLEEIGYHIENPKKIFDFYPSPGACTERCYLFFDTVSQKDKTAKGGGLEAEQEDIQLVKIPVAAIEKKIESEIIDAKTIIALQWFLMHFNKKTES